jgi:hypothetical protein
MNRMTIDSRRCTTAGIARWLAAATLFFLSLAAFGQANPRNYDHNRSGFPLTGIHATQACESCHLNGVFRGTPRDCSGCHTAGSPHAQNNTVKPQRHVPVTMSCDSCHTTRAFTGRTKFNHNMVEALLGCQTCHDGNGATGRSLQHIPVSGAQRCSDCHQSFVSWLPSTFSHKEVVVANQCETCHNGRFPPADGENQNHVPYKGVANGVFINCDSCHKASFINWAPARVHSSANVINDCRICHVGIFPPAVGQPNTPSHVNADPNCETCHRSTSNWSDVVFVQSVAQAARAARAGATTGAAAGGAALQRSGIGRFLPKVKPVNHIPVPATATCESCHRSSSNLSVAIRMDHRAVAGTSCKQCHNGAFTSQGSVGARGKPANHIPEMALAGGSTMDCSTCHVTAAGWTTVRMNHNGTRGGINGGGGTCKTCHQQGAAYLGAMEKRPLNHRRSNTAALDCSESGCHRPQGRVGANYKSWD